MSDQQVQVREPKTEGDMATAPKKTLAIGLLNQAAHDLRKFHSATYRVERELYLDAYSWIMAADLIWPYSIAPLFGTPSRDISPAASKI